MHLGMGRLSDVSWLLMDKIWFGPKIGRIKVGHKGKKIRELYEYKLGSDGAIRRDEVTNLDDLRNPCL